MRSFSTCLTEGISLVTHLELVQIGAELLETLLESDETCGYLGCDGVP